MKVNLFGATGQVHPKLRELVHANLFDYSAVANDLRCHDACFFCLGVTSLGTTEEAYARITYDLTRAAGQALAKLNLGSVFIYVFGTGTDSTEKSTCLVLSRNLKGRRLADR